eukprot:TRINITY_DN3264_c0_g1_i1.p1 TRINITY_DN3264_c0_g1~~TRINITY_DN3264_c0_g1_i1.p1  ORF type:complete len:184 (-),score=13.83 TRINITY_DN3264_c0_g1_i1:258-809(-)
MLRFQCVRTCHKNCPIASDADKQNCHAISGDHCIVCPGKCHWSEHSNVPFVYETYIETTTQVATSKEKAAANAARGLSNTEVLLRKKRGEYKRTIDAVHRDIKKVRTIIKELNAVALRPSSIIEEDDHFAMMIVGEKQEAKEGWQARVKSIEEIRQCAKTLREITSRAGRDRPSDCGCTTKQS